jgi:hypothetical protein
VIVLACCISIAQAQILDATIDFERIINHLTSRMHKLSKDTVFQEFIQPFCRGLGFNPFSGPFLGSTLRGRPQQSHYY